MTECVNRTQVYLTSLIAFYSWPPDDDDIYHRAHTRDSASRHSGDTDKLQCRVLLYGKIFVERKVRELNRYDEQVADIEGLKDRVDREELTREEFVTHARPILRHGSKH